MKLRLKDLGLQSALFFTIFTAYYKGLCPTIFAGDSAELTTAAHLLGIAHPSGYPLYLLILKGAFFIPFDSIAVRANMISALFTALAFVVIFKIFRKHHLQSLWLIIPILMLSFSKTIWEEATVARVYGLNLFAINVLILIGLSKSFHLKNVLLFSFLSGLFLGNHLQVFFTILPLIVIQVFRFKKKLTLSSFFSSFLVFLLGLSIYIYMPIRASTEPAMNWENPQTYHRFTSSILRQSYWHKAEGLSSKLVLHELGSLPQRLVPELSIIGFILAILGFSLGIYRYTQLFSVLLLTSGFNLLLLLIHGSHYDLFSTNRYHMPLIFSFYCGVIPLAQFFFEKCRSTLFKSLLFVTLMTAIIPLFIKNFSSANRSEAFIADDLGYNIEALLPPNAGIFVRSDGDSFSLAYRKYILQSREDIYIIHRMVSMFSSNFLLPRLPIEGSIQRGKIESKIIRSWPGDFFTIDASNMEYLVKLAAIPYRFIYKIVPSDWRFKHFKVRAVHFRNRPVSSPLHQNSMVQLIQKQIYQAGAAESWHFENILTESEIIQNKISHHQAEPNDYDKLVAFYKACNLKESAARVKKLKNRNASNDRKPEN